MSTCSTLTQNTDTNCTEKRAGAQQVQDTSDDIPLQTLDDEDCTWPQRRTAENLKPQSSAPASSNSPRTVESWRSRAETSKLRRHRRAFEGAQVLQKMAYGTEETSYASALGSARLAASGYADASPLTASRSGSRGVRARLDGISPQPLLLSSSQEAPQLRDGSHAQDGG